MLKTKGFDYSYLLVLLAPVAIFFMLNSSAFQEKLASNELLNVSCLLISSLSLLCMLVVFSYGMFTMGRDFDTQGGVSARSFKLLLISLALFFMSFGFYSAVMSKSVLV